MAKVKTAKKITECNVNNENRAVDRASKLWVGELKVQIVVVKWCKYFTCACIKIRVFGCYKRPGISLPPKTNTCKFMYM